tara:strand:- start:785 stop:1216 length:432 start_codon:yes stop_codon:yes gene_type:complete
MEKNKSNNEQDMKKLTFDDKKKRMPSKSVQINKKRLPWWVELLFVQIGLPDKWLIKILKTKKSALKIYNNEKKILLLIFLFIVTIGYLQPVFKYSSLRLRCQKTARNYIKEITEIKKKNPKEIEMLAVNFCNGGDEIKNFYRK